MSSYRIVPAVQPPSKVSVTDGTNEFGTHDTMRHGLASIRSQVMPSHPLESHLKNWDETQQQLRNTMQRQVFGRHLPVRMQLDKQYLSQLRRMPGLPSSNLGLSILEGTDGNIDFEDFLTEAVESTDVDGHGAIERVLGIKL
ncbi:proteasome maturation factor UMP1 [Polychytrium aggregatum]|uniref:proteasome maturation factor UMP1 n=1 Tax=Polychytrium aggregatum TaxID=110093 RepID=UPI0022FE1CC7|nr:proteasome maturation factor UMP1 [Polychytrium aggregatum]KAI9208538.1 proteasome maturation factor UMP1 [Polychytrium aggregatum]